MYGKGIFELRLANSMKNIIYRDKLRGICFMALCLTILIFSSCATYHVQNGSKNPAQIKGDFDNKAQISHTFVLVGDAGNVENHDSKEISELLKSRLEQTKSNSTLIFLGDNIYEDGMPPKGSPTRADAEEKLNNQLNLTKKFKGKTIFIPGNHDWNNGIDGIKEQQRLVDDFSTKTTFSPKNACGLEVSAINDDITLIVVDSYWFLQDWDNLPEINSDCEIKTREQFFETLEKAIADNENKTVLLATHNPILTHGSHGGEFPLRKHLFPLEQDIPLPIIGTAINLLRKTSGISIHDIQNKKYGEFARRIRTLLSKSKHVVVISGHDHNLQYIDEKNIKQIISGAGSKKEGARAINENDFSYGRNGYAVLEILKDGAAKVSFYGANTKGEEALLAQREPLMKRKKPNLREYPSSFAARKDTTIYTSQLTSKKGFYRFLWGNHYRKYYSTKINAEQVELDTLFGGLTPTVAGTDDASRSLILTDKNGRTYVMRALKKSGSRFLQSVAFKDQTVESAFRDTYTEDFILDFYTTAYPFAPLAVSKLAAKSGVNHTNPRLYFVPKQNRLGLFNEDFGGELNYIEEDPTDSFHNFRSFGKPDQVITTEDLIVNLGKDYNNKIDKGDYIRARLFDMLIGDWDRDEDQWRWGAFKQKQNTIYRPIPINRDQAFTKFDGLLFKIIMNFPVIRHMKTFDDDIKNIKWFNRQAYNLDLVLLPDATKEDWLAEADYIMNNLSDAEIDIAFKNVPSEVQDENLSDIKSKLKKRREKLREFAARYFEVLQKKVIIRASELRDKIVVTRNDDGTQIQIFDKSANTEKLSFDATYSDKNTNEIWLYGLGDEDVFEVSGDAKKPRLRLMGGAGKDLYTVKNGRRVKIYDFILTDSDVIEAGTAKLALSDSYERNNYIFEKAQYNVFAGYPLIGFNPDDGIKVGGIVNYSVTSFNSYPLAQKHSLTANYFFATSGYELLYKGYFPKVLSKWDFVLDLTYTSPNFSRNYFGIGNETPNNEDDFGKNYNRVKIRTMKASPSLQWIGEQGSSAFISTTFERNRVDRTNDRFIETPGVVNPDVFDYQNFGSLNLGYAFENYDNVSNPTLGMNAKFSGGFTMNIDTPKRNFPFAESQLGFTYRLSTSGNWVLETLLKGRALFSDDYEFYQAATVGGDTDLRGFRNNRFAGKYSFFQSTDLRLNLGRLKNGIGPVYYGVFGGVDYGRVWLDNDTSQKWHQSAGGGIYLNGVNLVTARLSYFQSSDGGRFSFGFILAL